MPNHRQSHHDHDHDHNHNHNENHDEKNTELHQARRERHNDDIPTRTIMMEGETTPLTISPGSGRYGYSKESTRAVEGGRSDDGDHHDDEDKFALGENSTSMTRSTAIRRAVSQLMDLSEHRSRQSMVDARGSVLLTNTSLIRGDSNIDSVSDPKDIESSFRTLGSGGGGQRNGHDVTVTDEHNPAQRVSAVFLACIMNFMISIPFGAAYFPINWSSSSTGPNGTFLSRQNPTNRIPALFQWIVDCTLWVHRSYVGSFSLLLIFSTVLPHP